MFNSMSLEAERATAQDGCHPQTTPPGVGTYLRSSCTKCGRRGGRGSAVASCCTPKDSKSKFYEEPVITCEQLSTVILDLHTLLGKFI